MLDVLFLSPVGEYVGGAERSLELLACGLAKHTDLKIGCAFLEDGAMVKNFDRAGIRTYVLPANEAILSVRRESISFAPHWLSKKAIKLWPAVRELVHIIRREGVKIIHSNGYKTHILASVAGLLSGARVVWHLRSVVAGRPVKMLFALTGQVRLDIAICVSNAAARSLPVGAAKKVVIYNATDFRRIDELLAGGVCRREVRAMLGVADNEVLIGNVGRVVPWKGQSIILDAFMRLAETNNNIKLIIVGGGDKFDGDAYFLALKDKVKTANLGDRVIFTGQVDNPLEFYPAMDIFVHTPIEPDPLPRSVMEATAFGLPVVAFATGGVPEMVLDGQNGILVGENEGGAGIANALQILISNSEMRTSMGQCAIHQAREKFSPEAHIASVYRVYAGLMHKQTHKQSDVDRRSKP